ncbi:hypothetical protein F3K34_23905 [Streptomyces sp. LBUM 1486]|nr:hypothetical protein [Streptomyces sp. LBUM 1485]MBP5915158.1 hypothetical protein [Streptomyces sp. LBUM 1486]QTU55466.1 hypothetical protein F3K21_23760 [Streptomyces sp. LBUM 1480]
MPVDADVGIADDVCGMRSVGSGADEMSGRQPQPGAGRGVGRGWRPGSLRGVRLVLGVHDRQRLSRVALPDEVRLTFAQVSLLQSARRLRAMNAEGEVVALRR